MVTERLNHVVEPAADEPTAPADIDDVRAAADRISPFLHRTPILRSHSLELSGSAELRLKCENFQRTGSFKVRGALNAVIARKSDLLPGGVITMSSGNFAQGLAWAAQHEGLPAHVVIPQDAPLVKRAAAAVYGATLYDCKPGFIDGLQLVDEIRAATGAVFISPHDRLEVIAGQGTAALELVEDLPDIDAIVTAVGGGGLVSGTAIVAKALQPGALVIGVEPTRAADAHASKERGELVDVPLEHTIADGLLARLGAETWPYVRDLVDEILLVDESEIVHAMRFVWERAKVVIEPSAAVAVAAVMSSEFRARGLRRVAVILSGGNVDLDHLPW